MSEKLERITYRIENNFFLTVIRHGLTLIIPVILAGGVACAFMNLPFVDYSKAIGGFDLMLLHSFLEMIYQGTFGVFSMVLVIVLALSYGMERNETVDKVAMYIIVALGSYGVQLNIGGEDFNIGNLGVQGCFTAMFIALFSCYFYQKLRNVAILSLRKYAVGMESLCANAIQSLLPMAVVILMAATFAKVLHLCFGFYNLHELFAFYSCKLFENMGNHWGSGLLYTFLLHILWLCGFHGSHMLDRLHRQLLFRCQRISYSVRASLILM